MTSKTVNVAGNSANGTHLYSYDNAGRISSWSKPSGAVTGYGFDDAGNRTGNGATMYSYDARNRLTSDSSGTTYSYNPRGGLTEITGGIQAAVFTYDGLDRLSTQTPNAGQTVTYTYDGLDRVASRGQTGFGYDGFEQDPTTVGAEVFSRSPDGGLLATSNGSSPRLVGLDRHGDVSVLAAAAGTVTDTRTWTPFGEPDVSTGSIATSVGFQGDYTDPTSGQVWMGARWYAPTLDAFTTRDTFAGELRTPISLNRYTYANGNPVRFSDPDGHAAYDTNDCAKKLRPIRAKNKAHKQLNDQENLDALYCQGDTDSTDSDAAAKQALIGIVNNPGKAAADFGYAMAWGMTNTVTFGHARQLTGVNGGPVVGGYQGANYVAAAGRATGAVTANAVLAVASGGGGVNPPWLAWRL